MINITERNNNESVLDYYKRLKSGVAEGIIELEKSEIYSMLFPNVELAVSPDHARKSLRALDLCIEADQNVLPCSPNIVKDDATIPNKVAVEINKDGSQSSSRLIQMSDTDSKDCNFLLEAHGYDTDKWEIISAKSSMWNTQIKGGDISTLYSSKITVKPTKEISSEFVRKILVENCQKYKKHEHEIFAIKENGKILEINISDLHIGKLAWAGEVGSNFDYKIASDRFKYIVTDVLNQVEHLDFERIYFIWSNDYYHFDTIESTTTAGTRQDTDLRWQKLFRVGVELLVWGIDEIINRTKTPLTTFYIGSNHDRMTSYYATNYLYAWYKDNPNVDISFDCIARKYIEYGNIAIGYCHGSEEGKNISTIMAKEKPEIYGRTKFRYIQAAHFHSNQSRPISEDCGCEVRYLSSPTGDDSWHYLRGYVGTVKCGYGFVYDKELGRRLEIRSNILV